MLHLLLAMALISTWNEKTPDLRHFQWKNRVLLLFTPSKTDAVLKKQTALVEAHSAGFEERDLIVFVVPDHAPLWERFQVDARTFTVVLIGKDGGEKFRQTSLLEPEKLFQIVDSMPMRRAGER
jgi:hypothetical protein